MKTSMTVIAMVCLAFLAADTPPSPAVSAYAPAADLASQIDYYVERSQEALADKDGYSAADQSRVKKDGNTLAVLLLAMGLHDADHPYKANAAELVRDAQKLAAAHGDYDAAKAAIDDITAKLGEKASEKVKLEWTNVADLEQLMKQTPTVNSRLRRGLQERSFKRDPASAAQYATVLAVIAQASIADYSAVGRPEDKAKWRQYCMDMRDAAGAVGAAARANDLESATTAMKRLEKSCSDCHAVFRTNEM